MPIVSHTLIAATIFTALPRDWIAVAVSTLETSPSEVSTQLPSAVPPGRDRSAAVGNSETGAASSNATPQATSEGSVAGAEKGSGLVGLEYLVCLVEDRRGFGARQAAPLIVQLLRETTEIPHADLDGALNRGLRLKSARSQRTSDRDQDQDRRSKTHCSTPCSPPSAVTTAI